MAWFVADVFVIGAVLWFPIGFSNSVALIWLTNLGTLLVLATVAAYGQANMNTCWDVLAEYIDDDQC